MLILMMRKDKINIYLRQTKYAIILTRWIRIIERAIARHITFSFLQQVEVQSEKRLQDESQKVVKISSLQLAVTPPSATPQFEKFRLKNFLLIEMTSF